MSLEYEYPHDEPTREEMEQAEADCDPPECICENASAALYNPDCYWHGTEGVVPVTALASNAPEPAGGEYAR